MKLNTYLTYQRALLLIHYILWPILTLLALIIPAARRRLEFESQNTSTSFKKRGIVATHCFHVSSEGELEQCMSILLNLLEKDHYIELVYTSDSVARRCDQLAVDYPKLNVLRMPLLSFPRRSFRRWVSAKKFFMCRYDFFSELILYGAKADVDFTLLSASLKGKKVSGLKKIFLRGLYRSFNLIVAASERERESFLRLDKNLNVTSFEFRVLQISSRLEKAKKKFEETKELANFLKIVGSRDPLSNLIIGSAWPVELDILKDQSIVSRIISGELLLTIAPHSLGEKSISLIQNLIAEISPELRVVIASEVVEYKAGEVYLNTTPGVLLETYSLFGHVLVGGGHGRSIHSVLEPYLAGARVYCGPRVFRSTEFDFIKKESPNDIVIIDDLECIGSSLVNYERELEIAKRRDLILSYRSRFAEMMERI